MMNSSLTERLPPSNVTAALQTATQRYKTKLARQVRNGAPRAAPTGDPERRGEALHLVDHGRVRENHGSAKSLNS